MNQMLPRLHHISCMGKALNRSREDHKIKLQTSSLRAQRKFMSIDGELTENNIFKFKRVREH